MSLDVSSMGEDYPSPSPLDISTVNSSGQNESGPEAYNRRESVLLRYALRSEAAKLLPAHRVTFCGAHVLPQKDYASVRYSRVRRSASLHNLAVCGSVWVCAPCSRRITEHRKHDLELATSRAESQGMRVALVTLTLRHNQGDELRELCDVLTTAWNTVSSGRSGEQLKTLGLLGFVRAMEITDGAHGFHPHLHVLLFLPAEADLDAIQEHITVRWVRRCSALGHPVNSAALDFKWARSDVAAYVAKFGHDPVKPSWSMAAEMTKWPVKVSRSAGMDGSGASPMQLLAWSLVGDRRAGQRFKLYAAAMFRRRQLVWSRGLRLLLDLGEEVSDQEAAEMVGDDSPEVARLTHDQARYLYLRRLVGALLNAVVDTDGARVHLSAWLRSVGAPSDSTWVADAHPRHTLDG